MFHCVVVVVVVAILLAQQSSVAQVLVKVLWVSGGVVGLTGQRTDPFHDFTSVVFIVFAHNL